MSLRFLKRIKIAPGVRLNVSLGGVSVTTGVRGANLTFGKDGVHANLGLPGSGFSYRTRLAKLPIPGADDEPEKPSRQRQARAATAAQAVDPGEVQLDLDDQGKLVLLDGQGQPLPDRQARNLRKQRAAEIDAWLAEQRDRLNQEREMILSAHLSTPDPSGPPPLSQTPPPPPTAAPAEPPPTPEAPAAPQPSDYKPRWWESMIAPAVPWMQELIESRRADAERAQAEWRAAHQRQPPPPPEQPATGVAPPPPPPPPPADDEATRTLATALSAIVWPRETEISFDLRGDRALLDVDMPEIEDMPSESAELRASGIRRGKLPEKAVRLDYMRHVHAVGFRIIGETFRALPAVQEVVLSAYTQRLDPATGQEIDTYLYSVRVPRQSWAAINFQNLAVLDLTAAFTRFELRRDMSADGVFRPVEPFQD